MAQAYRDPIESARLRERDGITKDEEKSHIENSGHQYEDPFGNEESAEVKYRTLYWWYESINLFATDEIFTIDPQCK
ncbi:hypothetical protein PoHVEF18_004225 [Penicillium ochrochloron]